jgi:sodium-independent organic anion transporter
MTKRNVQQLSLLFSSPDSMFCLFSQCAPRLSQLHFYPFLSLSPPPLFTLAQTLSLFGAVQNMIGSGFFPLSVTSIQRQFGYSSRTVGGLASVYDCVVGLASLFIAQFLSRSHTPRILGQSMLLQALGAALFLLPVFVGPTYNPQGTKSTELCGDDVPQPGCNKDTSLGYYFVFVASMVLLGIASPPIYNIGFTYFDDNIRPERASTHMAVFFVACALGPAVGYVLGGTFLNVFVLPSVDPRVDTQSSAWVGAWWIGYAVAAGLSLLLAPLFFLIPRELPGLEWVRRFRRAGQTGLHPHPTRGQAEGEDGTKVTAAGGGHPPPSAKSPALDAGQNPHSVNDAQSTQAAHTSPAAEVRGRQVTTPAPGDLKTALASFRALFTNPAYLGVVVGNYADVMLMTGVSTFLPAVVETQFQLTSSEASLLAGGTLIGGGLLGTLAGGLLIRWLRWSPKQTARAIVVCSTLTIAFFGAFFVQCDSPSLAGINSPFPTGAPVPPRNATPWQGCDTACHCESHAFRPICFEEGHLTYFSPCAAGCANRTTGTLDPSGYINCTCAGLGAKAASTVLREGKCQGHCQQLGLFLGLLFMAILCAVFGSVPSVHVTMRCVEEQHRSLALSFATFCSRILGSTFSPLVLGIVLDRACILWDITCRGDRGSCLAYNNHSMANNVLYCVVAAKTLATLGWLVAWLYFPRERDVPFESSSDFEKYERLRGTEARHSAESGRDD